ncbi:ATP-binding protein [Streptomyces xiamenensis]|uniref:ATP-binding protein n=1 Tax=Streptomyces xiamenensis TaxID=408015 RepID=UPI0036AD5A95
MSSSVATYRPRVREYPLTARAADLELWRREAAGVAREWRASPSVVNVVRLGVTELLSNVIKHVDDQRSSLMIYKLGDALVVSVSDRSLVLPEVCGAPDWDAESGRGLWMLQSMAASVGSHRMDGLFKKCVWFRCDTGAGAR